MADNNNTGLVALKNALSTDSVKQRFEEMLGKKAPGFISNIMSVAQSNTMFNNVDRNSVILAAAQAAALDLSINPNLGLAALIPYGNTCTFQLMRDAWVELCLRTGQFKYIVNEAVYEGELVEKNRFTDTYVFDESKRTSDKIVGYMAAFQLNNGYTKTVYWTVEECKAHGKKYSKTFGNPKGLWTSNFDAMAKKGLAVNTPIKTYNRGWIVMGEIEKGDIVYDGEGRLTKVIAVSERKTIPCYKITFNNGQEVICDEEHDWVVRHKSYNYFQQVNIKELFEIKSRGDSLSILTTQQGGFDVDLPVDPYCLGYWIGNGSRRNSTITSNSEDTEYVSMRFREAGYDVWSEKNSEKSDTIHVSRLDKSTRTGGFAQALSNAEVLMNKHIPEIYELASYSQRLELIRGLLDSDGCCTIRKEGTVRASFCQEASKKHIVDSLYRLLCSIGEQPSLPRKMRGHGFGKYIESYQITFTPREDVFGVPRKKNKQRNRFLCPSWGIKSIEKIDPVETICIGVDSPSKTYLCTESQIRTHNTVLKHLLKKYAPKSIEVINRAMEVDQAAFTGTIDNPQPVYVDNQNNAPHAEEVHDFQEAEVVNEQTGEVLQNGGEPQTTMFDK